MLTESEALPSVSSSASADDLQAGSSQVSSSRRGTPTAETPEDPGRFSQKIRTGTWIPVSPATGSCMAGTGSSQQVGEVYFTPRSGGTMRYCISRHKLAAACSLGALLVGGTPIAAEEGGGERCKEDTLITGNFHRFGSTGACYQGTPNATHDIGSRLCSSVHAVARPLSRVLTSPPATP